jgi:hypothetical protein
MQGRLRFPWTGGLGVMKKNRPEISGIADLSSPNQSADLPSELTIGREATLSPFDSCLPAAIVVLKKDSCSRASWLNALSAHYCTRIAC